MKDLYHKGQYISIATSPLVLDWDGINAIQQVPSIRQKASLAGRDKLCAQSESE